MDGGFGNVTIRNQKPRNTKERAVSMEDLEGIGKSYIVKYLFGGCSRKISPWKFKA